jgi:hypothetical protein
MDQRRDHRGASLLLHGGEIERGLKSIMSQPRRSSPNMFQFIALHAAAAPLAIVL